MTDKLNDNDKQRIEQEIDRINKDKLYVMQMSAVEKAYFRLGAEYATIYEREQQEKPQIESDANALLLGKLLDLCDQCYHYMKYNPPDKTKMSHNSWEDILEKLKYYKSEYYDTNDWKVFNERLNSLKTK